jgi:PKD repeat protein
MRKYLSSMFLLVLILMPVFLAAGNIKINDFSANVTNGTIPLHTRFTGDVTGNVTSWRWIFENIGTGATTYSGSNLTTHHNFGKAGIYNVTLNVWGPDGNDTLIKPAYITAMTVSTKIATKNENIEPVSINAKHENETTELLNINTKPKNGTIESVISINKKAKTETRKLISTNKKPKNETTESVISINKKSKKEASEPISLTMNPNWESIDEQLYLNGYHDGYPIEVRYPSRFLNRYDHGYNIGYNMQFLPEYTIGYNIF